MSEHFIKKIKIKNFKCFENFSAEDFGRVNLIGGKNNVGKTALMEACYIETSKDVFELYNRLLEIDTHRNIINNLLYQRDKKADIEKLVRDNLSLAIENVTIKLDKKDYLIHISTQKNSSSYEFSKLVELLDLSLISTKSSHSLNFIGQDSNPDWLINHLIGKSKLDDKYTDINKLLSSVFDVESIDMIDNLPYIKKDGKYLPLHNFGQGIKSFIDIIFSIVLSNNHTIFIDEIENGIHYTNFDKLWEIILTISKQQNVQVFATTHSKECIESYAKAAEKLDDNDIAFIEMGKNKEGHIRAIVTDSEQFFTDLEVGNEVRGW